MHRLQPEGMVACLTACSAVSLGCGRQCQERVPVTPAFWPVVAGKLQSSLCLLQRSWSGHTHPPYCDFCGLSTSSAWWVPFPQRGHSSRTSPWGGEAGGSLWEGRGGHTHSAEVAGSCPVGSGGGLPGFPAGSRAQGKL